MADFLMPSLGADMESATLVGWLVKAGDTVRSGQVIAEVETDKGVLEIEVFENGVVTELVAQEGQKIAVGGLLARILDPGVAAAAATPPIAETEAPSAPPGARPAPEAASVAPAAAPPKPPAASPTAPRRPSSPAARVLAANAGVDIALVEGTGPGGAVTIEDVRRASVDAPRTLPSTPGAVAPRSAVARAAMRASIAALLSRSKREIPHYYLSTTIDMSRAKAWLEKENLARPITERVLPAALLIRAVAVATTEVPEINGFFVNGAFTPSAAAHVGVAISLRDAGLIAPAILDVPELDVGATMAALKDLVARARAGRLRASEMSSPTITVTNLGDLGVDCVFGVIYPPQVAIVGFGRVADRPPGMPGARPSVTATLSADHRVSDGHRGALFLAAVDRLLQSPEAL